MVVIPEKMRRINQRILFGRLQRLGLASRADLAKDLGMSQPTAGKIVDQLLRVGILEEIIPAGGDEKNGVAAPTRLGRPGRLLRLNNERPRFLVIQLGVVETRLAAVPVGGNAADRWAVRVPTPASAEEWVANLRAAADKITAQDLWGVLVSVPGIVDEQAERVLFSPNLHWTEKANLPILVRQVWNLPVLLVQEVRSLVLGHQTVEPDGEDFLLVDFGQGVGGAVFVGGKLYAPSLPMSGELGHAPVPGNKRRCGCGAVGCVETLVSRPGLLTSFAAAHHPGPHSWEDFTQYISTRGVPPWLMDALDAAAAVIAGAINVLGLRRVIITGSLTELPAPVIAHLSASIRKGAMWARFGEITCQPAPRRRMAGLVAVGVDRLIIPVTEAGRMGG